MNETVSSADLLGVPEFNLFTDLATSADMEINGVWVEPWGPKDDGYPAFKIARPGGSNIAYDKALTTALMPYQKLISAQNKNNPDEKVIVLVKDATKKAFSTTCIKGWINVKNAKGEILDWSPEAAHDLCKQLHTVYETLNEEASALTLFREESIADEVGN
jgi:hypothetical protein